MMRWRTGSVLAGILVLMLLIGTSAMRFDKASFFLKKRGFVEVKGSELGLGYDYYILSFEISNNDYRKFLYDLKINSRNDELAIAQVDTSAWDALYGTPNAYTAYYFQHESYGAYPVVNISVAGAELYCKWLSEKYANESFDIEVRLPDSVEWKLAARGGDSTAIYGWGKGTYVDRQGYYKCNAKKGTVCDYTLSPILSFDTNPYGLFNMSGNAAEMLRDHGAHKGGSWESEEPAIRIDGPDPYKGITTASPYIGFRPVAIIRKK